MSAAFQGQAANLGDGVTTLDITIASVAQGEMLVCAFGWHTAGGNNPTLTSVSSDVDGALTVAVQDGAIDARRIAIAYLANASAGTHVITITLSGQSPNLYGNVQRYSGMATASVVQDTDSVFNDTQDPFNVGTVTTAAAGLIVSMSGNFGYGTTKTAATNYTGLTQSDPLHYWFAQYRITTSGVTNEAPAFDVSASASGYGCIAALAEAGGTDLSVSLAEPVIGGSLF